MTQPNYFQRDQTYKSFRVFMLKKIADRNRFSDKIIFHEQVASKGAEYVRG